jgi:ligand-binding sensor domain-containing protein
MNICSVRNGVKKVMNIGPAQGLPDYIVTNISPAGNDQYWISLQDKGFCLYDHTRKKIVIPAGTGRWQYGQVNDILAEGHDLFIATAEHGRLKYSMVDHTIEMDTSNALRNIGQLLRDNQGNSWLTSPERGLLRTPGAYMTLFPFYPPSYFEIIHAILYDSKGTIWLNDDMALRKFTKHKGKYSSKKIKIPGLRYESDITALYEDKFNNIWIATMGQGLYVLDPARERLRHVSEHPLFKNASVLSLSGKGDTIFACSLQGAALISLAPANDNIDVPYQFTLLKNANNSANFIYSIYKDSRDRVWFATDGMGLFHREANGTFKYYNDQKAISNNHIYSITEDKQGHIWFSTASDGIYQFDGSKFTNFTLKDGLSDLQISVIKCISSGHLVIVNKKGLDILDPKTGHIFYLNTGTGLGAVNADNLGAVTTDTEGNILVTTLTGIFSYKVPVASTQKPVTLIETIELFNREIDRARENIFNHEENNFNFHFTGLYYTDPSQLFYKYRLDGLDTNWVITKDRNHTFAKLEPGKYTFRIQSALNKNFKDAHEASYSFSIQPPFYQTSWFIAGTTLLLAASLFGYVRKREKQLKKIQQLQNEKMQFKFEVLRNQVNPHFLFNSFNTLISAIEEDPRTAAEYAEQLSDFFRMIVSYRDTDIIPLQEELEILNKYFFLQQKRYGSSLQLNIEVSPQQQAIYDIPPLTLQLLVENAVKHNIVSRDSPLNITVKMGADAKLSVINEKNMRTARQAGAGMGLQNIMNRFKMLTGRDVEVLDEEKRFIVILPLIKRIHDKNPSD